MSIYGAQSAGAPVFDDAARDYDALLVVSFGGPEGKADVMPFLRRVTEGRNVPEERLKAVAAQYDAFDGVSPINAQNRALIAALETELAQNGPQLPIYFGNRNWHPFVNDTVRRMRDDGVRHALVFVTSAFSSYSGCRQYREDVIHACESAGRDAPVFDKLRVFYNHPGFIAPAAEKMQQALARFSPDAMRSAHLIFTAHSLPIGMARQSDYIAQLEEACRLVVAHLDTPLPYRLAYQSRSGPPHIPWLEPDITDALEQAHMEGVTHVVIVPIGFISDHMEMRVDLDIKARQHAGALGIQVERAETVGTHPMFVQMIRELVLERMTTNPKRRALGTHGPHHDICPADCCMRGDGKG